MVAKINILDCTLRDGGYYNSWDYPPDLVTEYLKAIAESKIDFVELGLRNFAKQGFHGAFAYTTDGFLSALRLPDGPEYGVMVDAKTILTANCNPSDAVDKLFDHKSNSPISVVRVAAHFKEFEFCRPVVDRLKQKGYKVGFNMMQAGGKSLELISKVSAEFYSWDVIDVLYFADSLGNMSQKNVEDIVGAIRRGWPNDLGIHTHDNMSNGLSNCVKAVELGVNWIDSTVTGMGRGAGNTQTERLLPTIIEKFPKYNADPIYDLVVDQFEDLQKEYGWGTNLAYFLGAQNDIHPTYIQTLLSEPNYPKGVLMNAIKHLSSHEGRSSYSNDLLKASINFGSDDPYDSADFVDKKFLGRDILLVGSGPSVRQHLPAIIELIKRRKPVVISTDIRGSMPDDYVDYYAVSHASKILRDIDKLEKSRKTVILPRHRLSPLEKERLCGVKIIDYGIKLSEGEFRGEGNYGIVPSDISISYLLAFFLDTCPDKVFCVGLDGFKSSDARHYEMVSILTKYNKIDDAPMLLSLTPTNFPIEKSSIYAPDS